MTTINLSDDKEIEGAKHTDLTYAVLPYILPAIRDLKYSTKPQDCMNRIFEMAEISVDSQLLPRKEGKPDSKVVYAISWAKQYLKNADYIGGGHGEWALTDKAVKEKDRWLPEGKWDGFATEIREAQNQYHKNLPRAKNAADASAKTVDQEQDQSPEDSIGMTELSEKKRAILALNDAQKKERFGYNLAENLVYVVAESLGFLDCEVTPQSGDGGIDLWGYEKIGPFKKEPIAMQMKNLSFPVPKQDVVKFGEVCKDNGIRGVFIATSDFQGTAKKWGRENYKDARLTLINGGELIQHMDKYRIWDIMAYRPGYSSFKKFAR